jgi:acyl-CoA thioesterase
MAVTLAQILDAMADQIRDVTEQVTDVDVQVEPRWVVNPSPPTIDMYPADPSDEPELRSFGDPLGAELITVRARVGMSDHLEVQNLLLAFMDDTDPLSVALALMDDKTLGGVAQSLDVRSRSGYVRVLEGGDYLGCLWQVVVIKARS